MNNLRLVLVSCCAPCSCGAIAELAGAGNIRPNDAGGCYPPLQISDFIVLFFNPNIYPQSEYQKRLAEQVRYCEKMGVKYHVGHYDHDAWLADVRGLENEPERGKRCSQCFKHRFKYAVQFARDNGYNAIASVLGVSRHKDQGQVDDAWIGISTKESGIRYMPIAWDKNQQSAILNQQSFYRQNYCGCEFSMRK